MTMYSGIFDTHAHYAHKEFNKDREALLEQLPADGISHVMLAGCGLLETTKSIALAEQYEYIYCAAGIHPSYIRNLPGDWQQQLTALAKHPKVLAIGECGLDYHIPDPDKAAQREVFLYQLGLAKESDKPVILHIREATGDALAILREHRPRGVVHCFSGSAETARELVSLGLYIGIGGVLTYENARKVVDAVKVIPDDRLVLETDCPYLTPVPFRRERNDSRRIAIVAEKAAELRGTAPQALIDLCRENGKRLFGIGEV